LQKQFLLTPPDVSSTEERSVQTTKQAKQKKAFFGRLVHHPYERNIVFNGALTEQFEKVPLTIIGDFKEHDLSRPKRINSLYVRVPRQPTHRITPPQKYSTNLQRNSRNHSTEETPPHDFGREEIGHFFQAEQHATDGRPKSDGHAGRTRRGEDLATFCFVRVVFHEEATDDVADAGCDMDERTFLCEPVGCELVIVRGWELKEQLQLYLSERQTRSDG
jgi:hypothetical protein